MHTIEQRAAIRRAKVTVKKVGLHSFEHNSFHASLDAKQSWELLAKLSQEAWMEQTGKLAPLRVDKSICRFIKLSERVL